MNVQQYSKESSTLSADKKEEIIWNLKFWMEQQYPNSQDRETEFLWIEKVTENNGCRAFLTFGRIGNYFLEFYFDKDFRGLEPVILFNSCYFHKKENDKRLLLGRTKFQFDEITKIGQKLADKMNIGQSLYWECEKFCLILLSVLLFDYKEQDCLDKIHEMEFGEGFLFKPMMTRKQSQLERRNSTMLSYTSEVKQVLENQLKQPKTKKSNKCSIM